MTKLENVRSYEIKHKNLILEEERPAYHLSPATGWLNDPNGFSFYKGEYHLFYQYYPYATHWDSMHWGHWTSKDLLNWKMQPAVFAPDRDYESGVFSGTAMTDIDGSHLIMYTAHYEKSDDGVIYRRETQCLARGNGTDYEKDDHNPVLTERDLPDLYDIADFRDPKIWFEYGVYNAVLVSRNRNSQRGDVLLFQSEDALNWRFVRTILENDGRFGRMWECPDLYELEGKTVVLVSAMAVKTNNPIYRNGWGTYSFIGTYDKETHEFQAGDPDALDLGFDFYAPQTMETPDGRRILVGWMQAPESGNSAPETNKWFGQMTFPRELLIKEGHLYQRPIRELEQLHTDSVKISGISADKETSFDGIRGRIADLQVSVDPSPFWDRFEMKFASNGENYIRLTYRKTDGHLILDRSHAGRSASICEIREVEVGKTDRLKIRVLVDRFSFEVFVNDGAKVLTGTMYEMPCDADQITFFAKGAVLDIEKHGIRAVTSKF
jgi:beta-fructofuranosidase